MQRSGIHESHTTWEAASGIGERTLVQAQIAANQRDPYKLTDVVFYSRHPDMRGQRIRSDQVTFRNEWLGILKSIVRPILAAGASASLRSGMGATSNSISADSDVRAAQMIAAQIVAGIAGATTQQLVEQWRQTIAPEIPITVLLAFIRFESGGNFSDATHGSPRNQPPFTQPEFYELGLFQTPAGLHGKCTTGRYTSCSNPPPGIEKPGDPSPWFLLCKRIGANPQQWQSPVTQVRVGLMNLVEPAARIRKDFPELFPSAGSDWFLRMAVMLPFARGGGYARAFLSAFRKDLGKLPEQSRWEFLRGKSVPAHGGVWTFDPANVDKKMALAVKLGYRPDAGPAAVPPQGSPQLELLSEAGAPSGRPAVVDRNTQGLRNGAPATLVVGGFPRYRRSTTP